MKKEKNEIEYVVKGNLTEFEDGVMVTVIDGKTPKIDGIDLAELNKSLKAFGTSALNRNIEIKISAKVVDEINKPVSQEE